MSTAEKSLDVTSVADAQAKISDIAVIGNGNTFQLLCKASSKEQGWMKSAKAQEISGVGSVVQVTTQQGDNVAEALVFVPGVEIAPDVNEGRKLVAVTTSAEAGFAWTDMAASAYRAYAASTGNKNFRGDPMPAFEELPVAIQTAWEAAVRHVGNAIETPRAMNASKEQSWQHWVRPQDR